MKRLEEYKFSEKVTPELIDQIKAVLPLYDWADTPEAVCSVHDGFCRDIFTLRCYEFITSEDYKAILEHACDLKTERIDELRKKERSGNNGKNRH